MNKKVRKAVASDFPAILDIYKNAVDTMNSRGINQWDDLYPDEGIIKDDIDSGFSYLYIFNGQIAAIFVLSQICDPEYVNGNWKYPTSSFAVIHRLCVSPPFQNQGIGVQTMIAAEAIIKSMNIDTVRLDAFSKNPAALNLYRRLDYSEVGFVYFRKGRFILFEKKL